MTRLLPFFAALAFSLCASSSFANGVAIPGGPTTVDGSISIPADVVTPPDPTTFEANIAVPLEPNRSYACTLIGASTISSDLDFISLTDPQGAGVFGSAIGDVTPAVAGDTGDTADNRIAIIPSGTGTQLAGVYLLGVANDSVTLFGNTPVAAAARVDCQETTLYGGYNTSVSEFNFLEVLNITNTAISAAITATNSDGTVIISQQVFTVQPNRRADIDIHSAAGPGKFGLLQLIHNGPYGALQAYVSQYEGPLSNFALTASLPLKTRDK